MKKETGIIAATIFGVFTAVSIFAIRRFLNHKEYNSYYSDYHQNFHSEKNKEEYHGIEYLSMN